jgi:hypothetical protein
VSCSWRARLAQTTTPYFPERGDWQAGRRSNPDSHRAARRGDQVCGSIETPAPRDQSQVQQQTFGKSEPHSEIIGPMKVARR